MKPARVLIVDDEPALREVISRAVESEGHQPVGAASAEEGLKLAAAQAFDLILLDNVLPGMSGLRAIGELARLSSAPVVLMTGQNDSQMKKDALLLGAKAFLPKPFDHDGLRAFLRSLLPAA